MSLRKTRTRVLSGVAALAIAGGVAAYLGTPARAETAHCGDRCVTLASQAFGSGSVAAVSGTSGVLLAPGYNSHEDFVPVAVGTVEQLAQAGKIPTALAKTYDNEVVYELNYAPYGELTGVCLGAPSLTAGSDTALQQCGEPSDNHPAPAWDKQWGALWVGVYRDHSGDYEPFVNVGASDTNAVVLTATSAGGALTINYMSLISGYSGTTVASDQMWESLIGIYGQTQAWPTPTGNEPYFLGR